MSGFEFQVLGLELGGLGFGFEFRVSGLGFQVGG